MLVQVGWAWALYKANKDFTTEADAQAAMDEGATPAVLGVAADGVTPRIYIVDDHHTLSALDYSGFSGVTVSVEITCDLRDSMGFDEMWAFLGERKTGVARGGPRRMLHAQLAIGSRFQPELDPPTSPHHPPAQRPTTWRTWRRTRPASPTRRPSRSSRRRCPPSLRSPPRPSR